MAPGGPQITVIVRHSWSEVLGCFGEDSSCQNYHEQCESLVQRDLYITRYHAKPYATCHWGKISACLRVLSTDREPYLSSKDKVEGKFVFRRHITFYIVSKIATATLMMIKMRRDTLVKKQWATIIVCCQFRFVEQQPGRRSGHWSINSSLIPGNSLPYWSLGSQCFVWVVELLSFQRSKFCETIDKNRIHGTADELLHLTRSPTAQFHVWSAKPPR